MISVTSSGAPTPGAAPIRILSPKLGESLTVRFLSDYSGILVHWHGGRTVACQGPACNAAAHKKEVFWKGYAAVQLWVSVGEVWRAAALEVTEGLSRDLPDEGLRGQLWTIRRARSQKKGEPVTGAYLGLDHGPDLPPAFNVQQVMCHFFRVNELTTWGADNPIPRAISVFETKGSPPPKAGKARSKTADDGTPVASAQETRNFADAIKERLKTMKEVSANGEKPAIP